MTAKEVPFGSGRIATQAVPPRYISEVPGPYAGPCGNLEFAALMEGPAIRKPLRPTRRIGLLLIALDCLAENFPGQALRQAESLSASFRKAAEQALPSVVAIGPVGPASEMVAPGAERSASGWPVPPKAAFGRRCRASDRGLGRRG